MIILTIVVKNKFGEIPAVSYMIWKTMNLSYPAWSVTAYQYLYNLVLSLQAVIVTKKTERQTSLALIPLVRNPTRERAELLGSLSLTVRLKPW